MMVVWTEGLSESLIRRMANNANQPIQGESTMKEVLEKEEIDRLAAWLIQAPHRATIGDLDKSGRVLRFLYEKVMKQASHIESLEKDAARYRVVRDPFSKGDFSNLYLEELDATVDAAMQS